MLAKNERHIYIFIFSQEYMKKRRKLLTCLT